MLNEKKEFEQYIFPLNGERKETRLKHKTITNNLSGISRAMTIIARSSLFKDSSPGNIEQAKNDLMVWCGDAKGNPQKASDNIVFGWLPEYLVKVLGEKKAAAFKTYLAEEPELHNYPHYDEVCSLFNYLHQNFCIEAFKEKAQREQMIHAMKYLKAYCKGLGNSETQRKKTSKKFSEIYNVLATLDMLNKRFGSKGFNKRIFNNNLERAERNDFKKTMYDKAIADAMAFGPLKRYYLVCDNPEFFNICYKTPSKTSSPFSKGNWSTPTYNKADLITKTTAAFLLEQHFRRAANKHDGLAPINQTDIKNWCVNSPDMNGLKNYSIEGRPLFVKTDRTKNVSFLSIDPTWMADCGWQIVPEENLDEYIDEHLDATFFSDWGSGEYLKEYQYYD